MEHTSDAAQEFLMGRINYEHAASMPYGPSKLRLDRMRRLLRRFDNPQDGMPIVHIAGTKGKGSTAAMVAAVLDAAGYRVGLYHSPHLNRIEERIQMNGQACTAAELADLVETIRPAAEAMDVASDGPTFFELMTAIALLHFARQGADLAVFEVGLGGRLDSTNVCQPSVAVITNISFDHTRQLGNTLVTIAREKAGIIKRGVPVVSGVAGPEPAAVIRDRCRSLDAPLVEIGVDFIYGYYPPSALGTTAKTHLGRMDFDHQDPPPVAGGQWPGHGAALKLGLPGRHQAANAAVALAAIAELQRQGWSIPAPAVRRGLATVRWPARIEVLADVPWFDTPIDRSEHDTGNTGAVSAAPTIVLDTAHNLASIEALIQTLDESFAGPRRLLVFGATGEKDIRGMLTALLPRFDEAIFTRYIHNPRGVPPEELDALSADLATPRIVCPTPADAWQTVRRMARPGDLVCITGSFYLAAELREAIFHGGIPTCRSDSVSCTPAAP